MRTSMILSSIFVCIFLLACDVLVGQTKPTEKQHSGKANQVEANAEKELQLPEIRKELARRIQLDQKARFEVINAGKTGGLKNAPVELIAKITKIDQENTQWLKQLVQQHGWLGKTLVGVDGAHHAWLIVQHADRNPDFQKACLTLMTKMPKGEVAPLDIAYLTDRVLIAEKKPQRYGTQCTFEDGKAEVKEVEDLANLNARRAEVGLPPMEAYLKMIEQMYSQNRQSDQ